MSDKTCTPLPEPTGSIVLDNPQVYALLMSTIDARVDVGIRERNENLRNWLIGILTGAVLLITAGGALTLKYHVDAVVDKAVAPAVAKAEGAIRAADAILFDSEVAALNFRLLNLDQSEGFTLEEAEAIIWEIQSLVSKGGEERLGELEFAMGTAVRNFAAADRLDLLIRLEAIAPDWFLNSATDIPTMIQASGFALLADAGAPDSWTDVAGSRREIYGTYRTYADRAEFAGYPELYLLYEMLLNHIEGRPEETIGNLIADADSLNVVDAGNFVETMFLLVTGATVEPTAESERIVSRVAEFLCKYREQSELLHRVYEEAEPQC